MYRRFPSGAGRPAAPRHDFGIVESSMNPRYVLGVLLVLENKTSKSRTRTSSESEHSINRPTPDPSQEGNERLSALPCEFIRSELKSLTQ